MQSVDNHTHDTPVKCCTEIHDQPAAYDIYKYYKNQSICLCTRLTDVTRESEREAERAWTDMNASTTGLTNDENVSKASTWTELGVLLAR